jgi:hypothetical protein
MEKINELKSEFDYNIYVLGRKNGRLFNYIFRNRFSWPLNLTEIVNGFLLIQNL